ncbi:hypothetical protein GCM10025862_25430 [Arsenicicoccus piscis]|uniref:beta-N-acetylhexosaminidase n=2 Tax=Arsenicicoccus piscis TaxID=673954 RepID=A0ABQ6HR79_9MICO|nr:hypothetical protein GCM10025862_25430 [Arsenicicoccus piscis]
MSPAERAGQLLMVAEPAGGSGGALDAAIRNQHVGNVFFLGGWTGRAQVSATAKRLAAAAGPSTGEVGLLVAADQEGGAVQQLKGEGFTRIPSARVQANGSPAAVTQTFRTVGAELKATGVNVDLAPVADAVPASLGKANKPIGYWGREYASTPAQAAPFVAAATRGLRSAGVAATVKHFLASAGSPATPTSRPRASRTRSRPGRPPISRPSRPGSTRAPSSSWCPRPVIPRSTRTTRQCSLPR